MESKNSNIGYFTHFQEYLYNTANDFKNRVATEVSKIVNITGKILDQGINKIVKLAKDLPATRDFTNFSSDPVFWGKIFIKNLDRDFKNHEKSKNKKELFQALNYYLRGSFEGKVLVNLRTAADLILERIAKIPDQNIQKEAQEFVFKTIGECQLQRILQTECTQQIGNSKLSPLSHQNSLSIDLSKVLMLGIMLFPTLTSAQNWWPSCEDSIECLILRDRLNYRQNDHLFNLNNFLQYSGRAWCSGNSPVICKFSSWIFPLNCADTNLQKIDFSNIEGVEELSNTPSLRFIGSASSPCDLSGSKFENTTFDAIDFDYVDLSDSTVKNSSFNKGRVKNSNFDRFKGDISLQNLTITDSSFANLQGEFDFSGSKISNVNFKQKIPSDCPSIFQKSAKFRLTGAYVEKSNFTIEFPRYVQTAFNITTAIIAEKSPQGTIFKDCIFDLEGFNNIKWDGCQGHASRAFNLTDTTLPGSIHNKPNGNSCSGTLVTYSGSLKNVSFPDNFEFPIEGGLKTGCSEFLLNDVEACGHHQLRESNYKCLTDQCNNVVINNDTPPTLREKFEDASILRPSNVLNGNLFSINKFLKWVGVCLPNATSCEFPEKLSPFNCKHWNVKQTDFSNLKTNGVIILSENTGKKCLLIGSVFNATEFKNATINNADFSDSEMNGATFEESRILASKVDNIKGSVHLKHNEIANSSMNGFQGNVFAQNNLITNTTFYNLQGNASFPNNTIQSSSFYGLTGNATFPNNNITNSAFDQITGNFNFNLVHLVNATFGQTVYDSTPFVKKNNYTFNATILDNVQFSVFYSGTWGTTLDATFNLIAENSTFNACSFTQNNDYNCAGKVIWNFKLTNTNLPNSTISAQNQGCFDSGAHVFFGGNLNNVTFPKGFQFPPHNEQYGGGNNIGCTEFTLNNVTACDLPYPLSKGHTECLTNACNNVTVTTDPKTVVDNFSNAIRIRNPFFLRVVERKPFERRFDVQKYFSIQNLCEGKSLCEIRYPILNPENAELNKLFWKNILINPKCFDGIDEISFSENDFEGSYFTLPTNITTFEKSTILESKFSSEKGSISLNNSSLVFGTLLAPEGEISLMKTESKDSHIQGHNITMLNSESKASTLQPALGKLDVKGSSLKQDYIEGEASTILFKETSVDQIFWNAISKKIRFLDSNSINLQNFLFGEFRNISNLILSLNNSNPEWKLYDIKNLNASLFNVSLINTVFEGVVFSGHWTFGETGSSQNLPNASFTRLENLELKKVEICDSLLLPKVKTCLKNMGYTIGTNVQFSVYNNPMSRKKKIILISIGASIAFTIAVVINWFRKRSGYLRIN